MPVPKKRLGHSDQATRRANWKATVPEVSQCPHCGSAKLPHVLCIHCGFYKGQIVSQKLHAHHHHDH